MARLRKDTCDQDSSDQQHVCSMLCLTNDTSVLRQVWPVICLTNERCNLWQGWPIARMINGIRPVTRLTYYKSDPYMWPMTCKPVTRLIFFYQVWPLCLINDRCNLWQTWKMTRLNNSTSGHRHVWSITRLIDGTSDIRHLTYDTSDHSHFGPMTRLF